MEGPEGPSNGGAARPVSGNKKFLGGCALARNAAWRGVAWQLPACMARAAVSPAPLPWPRAVERVLRCK